MEYAKFANLCKYLGDQSLDEADRWKSLKYINISDQASPGFDFQRLLRENRINFIKNTDIGPGFVLIDAPFSDMGITNLQDPVLTFIPLESIDSFTFVVTKEPEEGAHNITIEEIVSDITEETYDLPVLIKFTNNMYYFEVGETLKFPVIFSRTLTSDNYDISYQDNLGNELDDKPTTIGEYYVTITCKDGYVGTNRVKFSINIK